jgi:Ca2+-binding RTX toxin-like protein
MADYVVNQIKWGSPTPGTEGGQVTWSFATLAGAIFDFDDSISEAAYQALVRAAFDAWEAVANIDFVEVSDSLSVDIRLGWDAIDGINGTVAEAAYSYFVNPGYDTFDFVEIRFDTAETWTTNPDYAGLSSVNFFTTALHEIGHALGLGHSSDPNAIMYFATNTTVDLTADDIAGAQAIYGAASTGGGLTGTAGNDTLSGTAGNDFISGLGGNDVLIGFNGNDSMFGGDGNDQLLAGTGDTGGDALYGGAGNDTLGGGAGHDTLVGGTGSDVLFGGAGNDWLDVGIHDTFTSDGASVTGTAWAGTGADRVEGDNTTDTLGGGSGNDTLRGYGGNDILFGGKDNSADASNKDSFLGGDGNDTIYGGSDADLLEAEAGADLIFGGDGNDTLNGGSGADELWGGAGNDTLTGGAGADLFGFVSGSGSDQIADFEVGIDLLDLSGTATDFTNIASVTAAATDTGAGLQIALGGGAVLVLADLTVADIASMDFVF